MNSYFTKPQIILLRPGTNENIGKNQVLSNIEACIHVADSIRSTLGPRGMDKLIVGSDGKTTISNDGATIVKCLEIFHPAAKILLNIAMCQESMSGDGTTSTVLIAAELLREAKPFLEEGVHPKVIIRALRNAYRFAIAHIRQQSISRLNTNKVEINQLLKRCAKTSVNSKLISDESEFFSEMVVNAVSNLGSSQPDTRMIGTKTVQGGSVADSFMVAGVAFKKTFSYAGFEQQKKKIVNPKILLLNLELELQAEKSDAEVRISNPEQYQSFIDAEWAIIYEKLDNCIKLGATVILSSQAIGDLSTQYFADRGVFCAGRVQEDDLYRTAEATGGKLQAKVDHTDTAILGSCGLFEEIYVGCERYNLFTDCPGKHISTIILRGSSEQFLDEVSRSLDDAIMVVKNMQTNHHVVPGGGAIEIEISKLVREKSRTIMGKEQIFFNKFAKALEVIPRQLCDNAGLDSNGILNLLRQKHSLPSLKGQNFGIDLFKSRVCDTYNSYIWEPALVKINVITNATEAACLVLSVDRSIRNKSKEKLSD